MITLNISNLTVNVGEYADEEETQDDINDHYEAGYNDGRKFAETELEALRGRADITEKTLLNRYQEGLMDGKAEQAKKQRAEAADALQICRDACNGLVGQVEARDARIKELEEMHGIKCDALKEAQDRVSELEKQVSELEILLDKESH